MNLRHRLKIETHTKILVAKACAEVAESMEPVRMTMPIPSMSKVAIDFFAMFARMEFALKRTKEFRTQDRNGVIKANWPAFAKSEKIARLFEMLSSDEVAAALIKLPPKNLVLVGEELLFGQQPAACGDMTGVCEAMKNARNNLFHGEKGCAESPREQELLAAGLRIMDAMLQADDSVAAKYYF